MQNFDDLEKHRIHPDLDIFVVPNFAQDVLGVKDPKALLAELGHYPSVGRDQAIDPMKIQWVSGDNRALMYRGKVLKRGKIWLQRGAPDEVGYKRYLYTGWQWRILPATADVAKCAEVEPIADAYDAFADKIGAQRANHYIITKYKDGEHNIGFHSDKPNDIAASGADGLSLITVVKIGDCARPFAVRNFPANGAKPEPPFFCEPIEAGSAILMTLEANLLTQHAVPPVEEAGPSGSIVFRTITKTVSIEGVAKQLRKRPRE
jgi:hypothetical protein